jgi:type I restriction enzyme S subunit
MKKYVTLGEVCTKGSSNIAQKDIEQNNGSYGIYGASGYIKDVDFYHQDKPYIAVVKDGAGIGRTMLLPEKTSVIGTMQYLIPKDDVCVEYLYYAVTYMNLAKYFSGATIPHIYFKDYQKEKLPLLTIEEQRKIADNLRKIDRLIELCSGILQKLDVLVKSRFVEMFGDIQNNDKGWIEQPLGEICEKIIRYPTFYGMDYIESGTRVIRIGNILNDGHMETNDENYVFVYDSVNDDFPETVIEENDIVMAVRGDGSAAKRIGFITEKCLVGANISPNLIRIKANRNSVIPIFLFYYLTSEIGQKRLDAYVNKTAKKNIAAKDIVKVISPVPPLDLQEQFAAFVEQTDKSKLAVKQVLEKAETLKKALMQEYFG